MKTIRINTPYITLGQLIKFAGIVQSGGETKSFLEKNLIFYNGVPENRRGKKLFPGDMVKINDDLELRIEKYEN